MKALVTGGAGFIGSHLALALEERGWETRVLDDFSYGTRDNLRAFRQDVIRADVRQASAFPIDWRPDVVFHQAGITDTTITDEELMRSVNVGGFSNVLDYAVRNSATVVYASSAAVYGSGATPMTESQDRMPLNSYAKTKCEIEDLAARYHQQYGLTVVGLRYFNVYGPGEGHKRLAASMIHQLALQMIRGKSPRLFKWGEQERDQIFVNDVVRANLLAAACDKSGTYNVGTGHAIAFNHIAQTLARNLKIACDPDYFDNPYSFYQSRTQADTSLARLVLGFDCQYDFETGVAEYLQFSSCAFSPA